jgi:hypothetical protein
VGTVTGTGPFGDPNYARINTSVENAYYNLTGQHTGITGTGSSDLLARMQKYVVYLNPKYKFPSGTSLNEALLIYLQEMSRFFEADQGQRFPGNPDQGILAAQANANHQSCILFLDSILHGLCAKRGITFPPNNRPKYAAGQSEDDYFVGYVDSIGNPK